MPSSISPNILRILTQTRAHSYFTAMGIQFVTVNREGRMGSIYFRHGRIRLCHPSGPEVDRHKSIERFTISKTDMKRYHEWKGKKSRSNQERYNYVKKLPSCNPAKANSHGLLIEFFGEEGDKGSHPSRGRPVSFRSSKGFGQAQINLIYNVAMIGSNPLMEKAVETDDCLRRSIKLYRFPYY